MCCAVVCLIDVSTRWILGTPGLLMWSGGCVCICVFHVVTRLSGGWGHLKIETRLRGERFESVMVSAI